MTDYSEDEAEKARLFDLMFPPHDQVKYSKVFLNNLHEDVLSYLCKQRGITLNTKTQMISFLVKGEEDEEKISAKEPEKKKRKVSGLEKYGKPTLTKLAVLVGVEVKGSSANLAKEVSKELKKIEKKEGTWSKVKRDFVKDMAKAVGRTFDEKKTIPDNVKAIRLNVKE